MGWEEEEERKMEDLVQLQENGGKFKKKLREKVGIASHELQNSSS